MLQWIAKLKTTTLDMQGQNTCIKEIAGNFHDVMYRIALPQFNSQRFL